VPDQHLSELFHQVQMARIFPDSKTFADCVPRFPVEEITRAFRRERQEGGFKLRNFVYHHFIVPKPQTVPPTSEVREMSEHIRTN
jgi:alpha,alpha-trehalase